LPHHKSCKKRLKTAAKERVRNNALKTALRTTLKDARTKIAEGEELDLNQLYTQIDKVRGKGTVHKNKAARLKSRLAKAAARTAAKPA